MKRVQAGILLILGLGIGSAADAQVTAPNAASEVHNVAAPFSATQSVSVASAALPEASPLSIPILTTATSSLGTPSTNSSTDASPAPTPEPAPEPRFVFGSRDDYRWQLAIGVDWIRFRSSIFNASAVGTDSSLTYFLNDWFGVEGDVATGFAPQIFDREHVKLLVYGGGPKIAWRENKWEPWAHAIVGGAHEQPQTAGNSRNAFAVEAGGGADYRINPRFSGRLEGDWVRTSFFGQSQNNFKLMAGVVFHF
ncbi:MAG TPA: hypothetical protein VJN93_08980 [Candidatus Acidoferrum sp.]|nr:hypothetical protein [Candidatus Acidoferrum sp.]